jgi:hypothetical protein
VIVVLAARGERRIAAGRSKLKEVAPTLTEDHLKVHRCDELLLGGDVGAACVDEDGRTMRGIPGRFVRR